MNTNRGLKLPKSKFWKSFQKSKRPYSHKLTFGSFPISQLPDTYLLKSKVLHQGGTFHCTAFASVAIQESQEGIEFDPDWFYNQEDILSGDFRGEGHTIEDAMRVGTKVGFKPLTEATTPESHKDDSYFEVDKDPDLFDGIRKTMWLGKDEKRCVSIGTKWHFEWDQVSTGIVPEQYQMFTGLHNVKCAGWTTINGVLYLIIQNSYGEDFGDKGFYYFSREIVNKEFNVLPPMCWRKVGDPEKIKRLSLIVALYKQVVLLYQKLIDSLRPKTETLKPIDVTPPPPVVPDRPSVLIPFTKAIEEYENFDKKYHNPGALKYTSYTQNLGAKGHTPSGFAIFEDYKTGFAALCTLIKDASQNKLTAYQDCTVLSFFLTYSPASDGNLPITYATHVAIKIGAKLETKLSEII